MSCKEKQQSKPRILANRYEIIKRLGKGNFGTVFLCKDLRHKSKDEDGSLKVLKQISVGELQPDETVDAMHEAKLLSKLDHPSVVQFHDSFIDGEFFCIVTEYCEGGDLDMKIHEVKKSKQVFDEKTVLDWFVQLLLAVHYIHTRRVLHRDLKTRNIFLKKNMVKVGDFGISRILMGTMDLALTFTGTPYYMSPEVLKHEGYNSKSDVWSIGCILYEMCALDHAFDGNSLLAVMYKIVEGEPPELPSKYSKGLQKVLKLMLSKDPEKRPSASELLKIPLISSHITKMSEDYRTKHGVSHDISHASSDAVDIARALQENSKLENLQKNEDDIKLKNLPPRDRVAIRKLQEADKEAKRLSEVARAHLIGNQAHKSKIPESFNKPSVPALQRGSGEGNNLKLALAVKGMAKKQSKQEHFGIRSAPDFPDTSACAEMLNSPFEEDCTPSEDDEDEKTVVTKNRSLSFDQLDANVDVQYGSGQATLTNNDDEDEFFSHLQYVLDRNEDTEGTMTLADDMEAGAFGPVAREAKINNLRIECENMLGKETFNKAYNYLKMARYERASETTEEDIMQGLREFVKNPSDCFLVDQLLFLEEQHGTATIH